MTLIEYVKVYTHDIDIHNTITDIIDIHYLVRN